MALPIASEPRSKPRRLAPPKPLALTLADASKATGLGITTLYDLISEGRLKALSVKRRRLVLYSSIEDLLGIGGSR
jgi:hypothetical protein